jgi:hypothetical protein
MTFIIVKIHLDSEGCAVGEPSLENAAQLGR